MNIIRIGLKFLVVVENLLLEISNQLKSKYLKS
jgi:hypothetical protein